MHTVRWRTVHHGMTTRDGDTIVVCFLEWNYRVVCRLGSSYPALTMLCWPLFLDLVLQYFVISFSRCRPDLGSFVSLTLVSAVRCPRQEQTRYRTVLYCTAHKTECFVAEDVAQAVTFPF